jgi:hypothetical protein
LSLKTKVDGLWVVWPQNHSDGFRWFGIKTSGDGFRRFALKTGGDGFHQFGLKIGGDGFLGLTSKLVVNFLVELQNQGDGGFSGLDLKIGSSGLMIWASKSPRQFLTLDLKTKWASIYRCRTSIEI